MKKSSKSGKSRPQKIIGVWEDEEWSFKRPQETLLMEEISSQCPRQLNNEENTSTGKDYRKT